MIRGIKGLNKIDWDEKPSFERMQKLFKEAEEYLREYELAIQNNLEETEEFRGKFKPARMSRHLSNAIMLCSELSEKLNHT